MLLFADNPTPPSLPPPSPFPPPPLTITFNLEPQEKMQTILQRYMQDSGHKIIELKKYSS